MDEIQPKARNLMIPLAIVIAGGLIAGAVFWNGRVNTPKVASDTQPTQVVKKVTGSTDNISPITDRKSVV